MEEKNLEAIRIFSKENRDSLNILNGEVMYEDFSEAGIIKGANYIPFNEAMSVNEVKGVVFSDEFNSIRAQGHGISKKEYEEKTLNKLKPLLKGDYDSLVVWFDEDMFCQINLIVLLAYIEDLGFKGRVYLNLVDEISYDFETREIELGDYKKVYEEVLLRKRKASIKLMGPMEVAIRNYLKLLEEGNRLETYIRENIELDQRALLEKLFVEFRDLGYGDRQYLEIIDKIKNPF